MGYKDKDKQREANRERQRRYKARSKALAKGVTSEGVTKGVTVTGEEVVVTLSNAKPVTVTEPKCITIDDQARSMKTMAMLHSKRGKDIKCFEDPKDLPPLTQARILLSKHGAHCSPSLVCSIPGSTVTGKPGDADYNGVCTEAWRAERGR